MLCSLIFAFYHFFSSSNWEHAALIWIKNGIKTDLFKSSVKVKVWFKITHFEETLNNMLENVDIGPHSSVIL